MVVCDAPKRQCLEWHIKPHLAEPVPADVGASYRALCPAHDDGERSLSISVKVDIDGHGRERERIVWQCFACKNTALVRLSLIGAGVPAECVPLTAAEKEDILDQLWRILGADTDHHGHVRLRAAAALMGYKNLPKGADLDRLAGFAHLGRSSAYRARSGPLPPPASTANTSSYSPDEKPVKSRRSA